MKKVRSLLVIDDDTDDTDLFFEAVNEVDSSVNCMSAKDGVEAIEFLSKSSDIPNLIFLDLNMPRMDGREFLSRVKKLETVRNVPIIVYTTSTLEKDERETKQLGAAHFISKPSVFDDLCKHIEHALNNDWS